MNDWHLAWRSAFPLAVRMGGKSSILCHRKLGIARALHDRTDMKFCENTDVRGTAIARLFHNHRFSTVAL
jgi:hypothetical protein